MLHTLLLLAPSLAHALPHAGQTSIIVVMKQAACSVCQTQLKTLGEAKLGAPLVGITHDPPQAAVAVTNATGVRTYSHPRGMMALGLWLPPLREAQPAVVVYDKCGAETGRIVGRRPGVDVTDSVRELVERAKAVERCGRPMS